MNIIKEWFGKSGLIARFYSCTDGGRLRYFVDYKWCQITSEVIISMDGNRFFVTFQRDDVPQKYMREISTLLERSCKF